jgi:hypothetical protein
MVMVGMGVSGEDECVVLLRRRKHWGTLMVWVDGAAWKTWESMAGIQQSMVELGG